MDRRITSCDSIASNRQVGRRTWERRSLLEELSSKGVRLTAQRRVLIGVIQEADEHLDAASLLELAVDAGLDRAEVESVLQTDRFADAVASDIEAARRLGVNGVPFFVIDGRYGISGAQPAEMFLDVLRRAAADHQSVGR